MHAVVVRVTINEQDPAMERLRSEVVPRVSQQPGFVNGYWLRKDNSGLSVILFDSEDAARQGSERVPENIAEGVTLESVELREVVAHA
jgi:heme-degrading monooxygenase HmoA